MYICIEILPQTIRSVRATVYIFTASSSHDNLSEHVAQTDPTSVYSRKTSTSFATSGYCDQQDVFM